MIPKDVIEKAIAGGWKEQQSNFENVLGGYAFYKIKGQRETFKSCEEIALDPDFWMALGPNETQRLNVYSVSYKEVLLQYDWESKAIEFYRLILRKASQEEIDNFWKAL